MQRSPSAAPRPPRPPSVATLEREAANLERAAVWSEHDSDTAWCTGRLSVARALGAQAQRQRERAAALRSEAEAIARSAQ